MAERPRARRRRIAPEAQLADVIRPQDVLTATGALLAAAALAHRRRRPTYRVFENRYTRGPVDDGVWTVGTDLATGAPVDLVLPDALGLHGLLLGFTGTGKTTTGLNLLRGSVAGGAAAVVILDGKGEGGLRADSEQLAASCELEYRYVSPRDQGTYHYDPCTGSSSDVANKLIGAQTYGDSAEVYKLLTQGILPVIVRALQLADVPVTIGNLIEALVEDRLRQLARQLGRAGAELSAVVSKSHLQAAALEGMQGRLRALAQGEFGRILERGERQLVLADALRGGVSYISFSKLGASEDAELFARVVIQDLKAVCYDRLRDIRYGETVQPAVVWMDEFHSLVGQSEQVIDLLLQARESRIALMVGTQFLPEGLSLRQALLGAGLLVCHRMATDDAEVMASQIGSKLGAAVTRAVDFGPGEITHGSVRQAHEYLVHPQELRALQVGEAVIKTEVPTRELSRVRISRPDA